VEPYSSWREVAGYFDGDGNISISDTSNQPHKLSLSIVFTDQSFEQIQMLKGFFRRNGIITSNVLKTSKGTANMIAISRFDSVLRTLKAIQPYVFKKSNEVEAAINYYESRISGNDLALLFSQEVEAGRRERHPRKVGICVPFTYPEGDALMRAKRAEKIRLTIARTHAKVLRRDYEEIREKYFTLATPVPQLVTAYPQYCRETIRRILGKGRGWVLIKDDPPS
jgi:hypothetical protein